MNIKSFIKQAEHVVTANSPSILTAIGVVGTVSTAVLTAKATEKAVRRLWREEAKRTRESVLQKKELPALTNKDKFKMLWKLYIPAATTCVTTVGCIIAANRIGTRRAAALAAAVNLSERALVEYRDKALEHIGEEGEQKIRDAIAQDRVEANPPVTHPTLVVGEDLDDVMCHEAFTDRYFKCSRAKLERAENAINAKILDESEGYATVSDFYDMIGLPHTSASDEMGWNNDKRLHLLFATTMLDERIPCLSFEFATIPMPNPWFMA